jgi:hypothetical protein
LDGLDLEVDADDAARDAHDRAAADVALIGRAFGMLGDALAAPVEEPTVPVVADDNVVALPLWRRRRTFLAAAASIAVMGLGITVIVANNDDGSDSNHSATAASGAVAQGAAPMAPAPEAQYRSNALAAAPADTGAAADSAVGTAQSAPAAAAPAAKSAAASTKAAPADDGTGESLADAVACARGILIGEIVSFQPTAGGKVSLTLRVTEWISPSSGPTQITYTVGDNDEDGSASTLRKGQKRLFVVPRSTSASVYTFTGPNYDAAKAKVAKAQDQDQDQQC